MNIRGRRHIANFVRKHAEAKGPLESWVAIAGNQEWRHSADLKQSFGTASTISANRVVFNIKGNAYRLDAKITYEMQILLVVRVGTHDEYDHWTF